MNIASSGRFAQKCPKSERRNADCITQYVTNLSPLWAYFENICETILGLISDNNPKIIKILPIHIFNLENPENLNSTF